MASGTTCWPSFSIVNPETIGCVWIGEFDLNTLRVNREIFESEMKQWRFQNIRIRVNPRLSFPFLSFVGFRRLATLRVFPRLRNNA